MVLIKTDLKTTRVTTPLPRSQTRAVLRVDRQLVEDLQDAEPGWVCWGEKINDLSPLWPFGHFRQVVMDGAKRYVRDLQGRGWTLLTNEGELRVWGPCVARDWNKARGEFGVTQGREGDEPFVEDAYDFIIDGSWLASTYLVETPTVQPQRTLSRAKRDAILRGLWPRRMTDGGRH